MQVFATYGKHVANKVLLNKKYKNVQSSSQMLEQMVYFAEEILMYIVNAHQ